MSISSMAWPRGWPHLPPVRCDILMAVRRGAVQGRFAPWPGAQLGGRAGMSEFQTVCKVSDLTEGEGKAVEVGGKLVAVFFTDGRYFAIDDVCPHMGASLSGGWVEDGTVTCPWHAWPFRLADGAWANYPKV